VGGICLTAASVLWAKAALINAAGIGGDDHIVVASSHISLLEAGSNWDRVRRVVRSGSNGADLALLDALTEDISSRYEELILASGDGIFTPAIAELASSGLATTVIGWRGSVARTLQLVASQVIYIPGGRSTTDPRAIAWPRAIAGADRRLMSVTRGGLLATHRG
jgi:hypothetical protein